MQGFIRFPDRSFLKNVDESVYNNLFDILLNIDTSEPVNNVVNVQRVKQQVVQIERTMPIEQRLELQSLEYIFGLEFSNEPINNTIEVCVINKIKLKDQINNSTYIDQNEKQMWLSQLDSPSCTEQTIDNITRNFDQYVSKCIVNKQITNAIKVVCSFVTKHYLNGEKQLGSITLPNMVGMQEDILEFYNHPYVQTQMSESNVGRQLQSVIKNPVTSLSWNLVLRGIHNKKEKQVDKEPSDLDGEISD